MSSGVVLDCPENVRIFPPSCQAGDVLTCTADSKPEAQYKWIEHHNNDNEVLGQTYTLQAGKYNLTCIAYINENCTHQHRICRDTNSWAAKEGNPADFPYSLFNLPAISSDAIYMCNATAMIDGYAIGKYSIPVVAIIALLGPFHGAIAVPSVTRCRCRCRRCRGHRTPPAL